MVTWPAGTIQHVLIVYYVQLWQKRFGQLFFVYGMNQITTLQVRCATNIMPLRGVMHLKTVTAISESERADEIAVSVNINN